MSFHTSRTIQSLCWFAVVLLSQSTVLADESSPSLYESRLGVIKGTSTGIVIYRFQESAASAPVRSTPEAQTRPSAESGAQPSPPSGRMPVIQPPSGRSLRTATQLGAEDGGIQLPTARTAAESRAVPVAKP